MDLFLSSGGKVREGGVPTQLGPLDRAGLNPVIETNSWWEQIQFSECCV